MTLEAYLFKVSTKTLVMDIILQGCSNQWFLFLYKSRVSGSDVSLVLLRNHCTTKDILTNSN